jgi:hypothetical protein
MAYSVVYWAAPRDGFSLVAGEELSLKPWESTRGMMIGFYRPDRTINVGYCDGDCATALVRDGVQRVRVLEVSELSGFARLMAIEFEPEVFLPEQLAITDDELAVDEDYEDWGRCP